MKNQTSFHPVSFQCWLGPVVVGRASRVTRTPRLSRNSGHRDCRGIPDTEFVASPKIGMAVLAANICGCETSNRSVGCALSMNVRGPFCRRWSLPRLVGCMSIVITFTTPLRIFQRWGLPERVRARRKKKGASTFRFIAALWLGNRRTSWRVLTATARVGRHRARQLELGAPLVPRQSPSHLS